MKKGIIVFMVCIYSATMHAQTGIGTTTPHASAKLEVSATNKGFLPPRVTLTSNTDATTIPNPAEGLLVYNNGNNLGLVAGYYYWNGTNWATIATAIAAGYGVAASEMQKLYDGVGNATTINSTGVTFTVPTSGTYLFDFSCSGTNTNGTLTMNFYVRDGSTVLKSDMQTSYSNNVHAEYNGKIEVNLVVGKTYNLLVNTTSGSIYSNDYCRVYMKQMSGNLPINQHMASRNIQLNNNYLSNDGDNEGIRIDNSGKVGIGTTTPGTSLHIQNGNTFGTDPSITNSPSLYIFNNNNASSSAHATAVIRTAGSSSGKPYLGFDINGVSGYTIGINNPTDQLILNTTWNFSTGTAGNNAITINRSGQSRVVIPSDSGALAASWPSGWGGGLITYDFACAGIYYTSMTARSDKRLKNTILDLDTDIKNKYLNLRPVNYYWNDGSDNKKKQYGFIAQEVELLFPELVSIANDSMQTKSVNYQALHALSLKVIQTQQAEIETLKEQQSEIKQRLLQLESKLNNK
jgi:hypothetical protein